MKGLVRLRKLATGALLAAVAIVGSGVTAVAQFTAADPATITDAYRVDKSGGVLENNFQMLGSGTNYLWLVGVTFVVGWMLFRRFRKVAG